MNPFRNVACAALLLLCATAWAQGPLQEDTRPIFDRALDEALPRDRAPVTLGDTRMTLRVVPPQGRESQVIFLLHGKMTAAEAMQAVSVRQEFSDWMAAGQTPPLNEWAKNVQVNKANFTVPPELRNLLDSYRSIDFVNCTIQHDAPATVTHYELWIENDQATHDIHGYSTRGAKCAGLAWMQQLRQAVRQQLPQLETR